MRGVTSCTPESAAWGALTVDNLALVLLALKRWDPEGKISSLPPGLYDSLCASCTALAEDIRDSVHFCVLSQQFVVSPLPFGLEVARQLSVDAITFKGALEAGVEQARSDPETARAAAAPVQQTERRGCHQGGPLEDVLQLLAAKQQLRKATGTSSYMVRTHRITLAVTNSRMRSFGAILMLEVRWLCVCASSGLFCTAVARLRVLCSVIGMLSTQ